MNSTTDLGAFERPEKLILGESEKQKKSKKLDLDTCLDSFRQEEILDDDNKWYCGK